MENLAKKRDPYVIARKRMITDQIIARGITDERVIKIMSELHRHDFVDDALKDQAYSDNPLSLGEGQTISQPYIVALMTQALRLTGNEKVLEIGTGCGYQTVILSHAAEKVYTIERVKSLGLEARSRFKKYGIKNIVLRIGDGSLGWPEAAPFDRIIVTCAAPAVPEQYIKQLTPQGILVVPVSVDAGYQNLLRITRTGDTYHIEDMGGCHFVKLIGKYGYASK